MFRIKIKFLILMIASYVFAYLQGGNLPYSVFYGFFITFIIALAGVLIHSSLVSVEVRFDKKVYSSGDTDRFTMVVSNNSVLPAPFVTVKNKALSNFNNRYNGEVITLKLDERKWLKYEVNFRKRGVYNFGEISLSLKDLFCIFETNRKLNGRSIIKVYPRVFDLEKTVLKGSDIFKNAVSNKSSIEDMYSTKDMRKYREGDNLKRINWKVSAKYNELFVRNFDNVSGQEFNIFLDMSEKNYDLDGTGLQEEKMVDFCVSLINRMLKNEIKTKLFVNASKAESFDVEEKIDFDKIMEYFLTQKSDSTFNFVNYIHSNVYHISSLGGIGVITGKISTQLSSTLMGLRDRGYNVLIFYCGKNSEDNNTILLEKVGISCYNILDIVSEESKPRIG